jgi:hypothetical protein
MAFLFTGTLFAQHNFKKNHVLFSPFYFLDGTFMLSYERMFQTGSLRVTPSIKLQNVSDQDYDQREGYGIDVGYKFFFTERPHAANFYMGPYALYKNINVKAQLIDDFTTPGSTTKYYKLLIRNKQVYCF